MKHTAETATAVDLIYSRRPTRAYAAGPVAESTVRGLIDAAVQAPTAMGAPTTSSSWFRTLNGWRVPGPRPRGASQSAAARAFHG